MEKDMTDTTQTTDREKSLDELTAETERLGLYDKPQTTYPPAVTFKEWVEEEIRYLESIKLTEQGEHSLYMMKKVLKEWSARP